MKPAEHLKQLLVVCILAVAAPASAATYYVSQSAGNDDWSGHAETPQ
jgi:hypothetical protein